MSFSRGHVWQQKLRLWALLPAFTVLLCAAGEAAAQNAPAKPTGFTATNTTTGADLAWTDPADSTITGYEYRRKEAVKGSWGFWTAIANSGSTTVSHSVTGSSVMEPRLGKGYTFQIRAVNANGNGSASDEKTALLNGICDRTNQVEKAILDAINDPPGTTPPISPQKTCEEVTYTDITNFETNKNPQYFVKGLFIGNLDIGSLKTIDFYGLKKIRRLDIDNNDLTTLPAKVFDGLTLTHLVLPFNDIATLPAGTFSGARIGHIDLRENELARLPETLFQGTISSTLKDLRFNGNRISGLPKNIFKGLTKLEDLEFVGNRLTGLPRDLFKDQSSLKMLSFMNNSLSALPYDIFKPLTALTELSLNNNRLWCLPYIPNNLDPSLGKTPASYPPCLPGTPVSLSATSIHEGLWVDWDYASHPHGGLDVPDTFTVQWRAGSTGTWSEKTLLGNTTDLTISSLTNGTAYQVRVRANSSLGESSWTSSVTGTPAQNGMTLTPAGGSVNEGGSLNYTVKLNVRPTANVTVTITRTGDTDLRVDTDANTPGDQDTLTFTPGTYNVPQLVVLTAVHDEDAADGTAVFTHTASGGGYNNVTATMSATEVDDDGSLTLSKSNVTVTEGGTATYTVVLAAEPGGDVTVTVARNAGGDDDLTADTDPNTSGNQNTLTFTTTDWDTAQTVTLAAKQDDDGIPGTAVFTHTASGGGYDGESASLTAIEKDDDSALNLTPANVTVQEGGQAGYTVVLSHRPTGTVTVTVARASGDTDLSIKVGSSLTFKTSNWNVPQTVVIKAKEDSDALNGAAVFAHTATGGGFSGITAQLIATEADKERGIVFSPTSVTVPEGGSQTYTVKLESLPVGNVTVTVARTSGDRSLTADTDSNQTGDQNTLTFTTTDWNTAQTVTLSAAQDNDNDNDEAVFTHTATGGGYGGVSAALTATEADDELGFKFSKLRIAVKEADPGLEACTVSNPTYTVKLNSQPSTCDVVVTVYKQTTCTDCDDDIKIDTNLVKLGDQNTLTFTYGPNGNWDTAQPVCLAALGDTDGIDGSAEITHWANQSCLGTFDGVNAKVTATEVDKNRYLILTSGTVQDVSEGDSKSWTVKLGSQPTADVTVTVKRELGGDPAIIVDTDPTDTDVDTTMTFTRTDWNTPQSFKVSALEDEDAEQETVKFSFVPDGGGYGSGDAYDMTFSTLDNDDLCPKGEVTAAACPAVFADISAESVYVPEGGTASIAVRLTARPSTDQTLTITEEFSFPGYYNTDTTVDTDPDTAGDQNTLTFTSANWSIPQTVTFATEEDNDETHYRETFRFTLPSYDYADLYVTESDNDIVVIEDLSDPTRNELTVPENGEASFKVKLSAEPTSTLTVKVVRRTGAAHDVDLTVKSGASLTFTTTDWNTAQTVTLQADDDSDSRHGTAAFDLEGTYAQHNFLNDFHVGALATVTAKEADDDFQVTLSKTEAAVPEGGTATYTVVLGTQPSANVSVVVARKSGGDADLAADTDPDTAGDQDTLTFTTTNYDTPQTVTLRAADDDDTVNGSAVFTHTATGGGYLRQVVEELTATEADADRLLLDPTEVTVSESGTATYTVALAVQPTSKVTVMVARTSGDADLAADTDPDTAGDQDTLTFTTTNYGTPQTVTLRANDDADTVNGSAVFTHTATGGGKVDAVATLTATEADDDEPPSDDDHRLALSTAAVTVPEGGTASYTLSLGARPDANVTVAVARESGDADLTANPATLSFTTENWSNPQTVTLHAADDADAVDGSAVFAHTATGGGYAGVVATLTATEADDDHRLALSAGAVTVPEGGTASYTLALAEQPTGTVTVAVARESGDADLTVDPSTLTFTTTNYGTPQTVTLHATDDADAVNGSAVFTHTATGGGYTGAVATLTATEADDDYRLALSAAAVTVPEGGTVTYTVALGAAPAGTVTVAVARDSGDADLTADPATLSFTTENWSNPQTVTLHAADDADAVDGSAVFTHTATGRRLRRCGRDADGDGGGRRLPVGALGGGGDGAGGRHGKLYLVARDTARCERHCGGGAGVGRRRPDGGPGNAVLHHGELVQPADRDPARGRRRRCRQRRGGVRAYRHGRRLRRCGRDADGDGSGRRSPETLALHRDGAGGGDRDIHGGSRGGADRRCDGGGGAGVGRRRPDGGPGNADLHHGELVQPANSEGKRGPRPRRGRRGGGVRTHRYGRQLRGRGSDADGDGGGRRRSRRGRGRADRGGQQDDPAASAASRGADHGHQRGGTHGMELLRDRAGEYAACRRRVAAARGNAGGPRGIA